MTSWTQQITSKTTTEPQRADCAKTSLAFQVAALLCVAGYLSLIGYRQQQAERYRIAATVAAPERRIPYREAAVTYAPETGTTDITRVEPVLPTRELSTVRTAAGERL